MDHTLLRNVDTSKWTANMKRAARGAEATFSVDDYKALTERERIIDTLANVLHWATALGIDAEQCAARAWEHLQDELAEDE